MRRATAEAGITVAARKGGAERVLRALAFGGDKVNPGQLAEHLEPLFVSFDADELTEAEFAAGVRAILDRLAGPPKSLR